ncbi:MAG: HDOD domain-containing protein [Acidihalobacter sp.]|uniref:HDOD domain-containing protein n=1 Tax=Acidihalobacter sp. TaxID=1872108 RepID=UPI00307F80BB
MSTDPALLDKFIPLHELTSANRSRLADKATVIDLPSRRRIEDTNPGRWMTYLLEGTLYLTEGTREDTIEAGSARAKRPLFPLETRRGPLTAQSRGPVRLLRLDRAMFDLLLREQRVSDYEVQDTPINDAEGKLLYHIYQAVKDGTLNLPSMPEVAMRIRDAAMRPDVSVQEIAQIVQIDPVVAGGVLRSANSAAVRGAQPINSLTEAVVRLGFEATRSLATRIAVSQIFNAHTPLVRERMHALWEHSVQTSSLASVLARHYGKLDPDHAQLTGLLHDIGCVPILLYAERESLLGDIEAIESALRHLRVPVGLLVLDYWDLDNSFGEIIQNAEEWRRDSLLNTTDYADLIIVAQRMLAPPEATLPALEDMPSYARLALGPPDPQRIQALLQEGQQQLAEIKNLLTPQAA